MGYLDLSCEFEASDRRYRQCFPKHIDRTSFSSNSNLLAWANQAESWFESMILKSTSIVQGQNQGKIVGT